MTRPGLACAVAVVGLVAASAAAISHGMPGVSGQSPIAARSCPGRIQGAPPPPSPRTVRPLVALSAADRRALQYFDFGGESILAPRGWRCAGTGGSNGDQVWAWNPRAGKHGSLRGGTAVQVDSEIVYAYEATIGPWAWRSACRWFPAAAREVIRMGEDCRSASEPVGTRVSRRGRFAKRITIPPRKRSAGATTYAGGPNAAIVQEWWIPGRFTSFAEDAAAHAVCVLPAAQARLCNLILDDYGARLLARLGVR